MHDQMLGQVQIVATISNSERWDDDYFLLSSIELIAAPRELPPELKGTDTTQSVSWGYLTTMKSLGTQIIEHRTPPIQESHAVAVLDLDKIIQESFSEDDGLWPWAFRTTIYAVDRYGKTFYRGSGVLRVDPPGSSSDVSPMPDQPLQNTRSKQRASER
jgi:hypothetical protein